MKKLAKFLGIFLALIFVAILVIPFVVDVDKYRPQIVQVANDNINGKLEIGKLKLSLWGKILVKIDGVKLFDAHQNKLVSVEEAYFHIPFLSLLSGSPELTFKMEKPQILVVKDKAGKLNLMSLMKTKPALAPAIPAGTPAGKAASAAGKAAGAPPAEAPQPTAAPAQASSSPTKLALPAIAVRARLGVEIRNALLTYNDLGTGVKSETDQLNLVIRDISLSRPTELELWANLNTTMAKVFSVKGPARIKAELKPTVSGGEFQKAELKVDTNFDDLDISVPGAFQKAKGIATNAHIEATVTPKDATVEKFDVHFHNAEIKITAQVLDYPNTKVKATIASNSISMAPWTELLPALKGFDLSGTLQLKAAADGPTDKLAYSADITLANLSAKAPMLKGKPEINAEIHVITDQVKALAMSFKAPGCDLRVTGNVVSFTKPRVALNINSPGLDLDKAIDFPPPAAKKGASILTLENEAGAATKEGEVANFDAMLAPLRASEPLREMIMNIGVSINNLKAKGMLINSINSSFTFKNLVANLEKFEMALFKGKISAKLVADMKPAAPTYTLNATIQNLDLKEAVTSSMEMFKNTVYGKLNMTTSGNGSSFNPDQAKQHLNLKGKLTVTDAVFASMDIGKMVSEGIASGMSKVGDKIPALKGKKAPGLPNKDAHYDSISSDFSIAGGKFSAPNFYAKASKGSSVDLKGATEFGLIDQSIHAKWDVIDSQNLTKARDISVDISGTKVDHILAKGNDPVSFPVTVSGTLAAPVYSYSEVPEYFAKIAMGNVASAAKGRVKDEAIKRVSDLAPAPAKNLIQGLGKKLFGH